MSIDKAQDPLDRAEQLLVTLTKISVKAIAEEVATALKTKFDEQHHKQTLIRSKSHIIVRRETVLEHVVYISLLNEVVTKEVKRIFDHFYPTNQDFCLGLVTKVCAEVYDRSQEDVRAEMISMSPILNATHNTQSPV